MLRSETANAPARLADALAGLRQYQNALRTGGLPPMPIVARAGRATIRDYGGDGMAILFVPSLINPPDVLDIDAERSLLRWLRTQGLHPLLLDWGVPAAGEEELDVGGHVETMLLPLIDRLAQPVALAGYCLGGTMAVAAAALRPVRALTLIATPWRFAAYSPATLAALRDLWQTAEGSTDLLGLLPMEVLQAAFWKLDPARTVGKYEAHGRRDPASLESRAFVRLEDWANDGPPLTRGAARQLFDGFFAEDLPGRGVWRIAGQPVDPSRLAMPILEIASTTDHIVPADTSVGLGERIDLSLGHVGMVVGSRAKADMWEPLAQWLSQAAASR